MTSRAGIVHRLLFMAMELCWLLGLLMLLGRLDGIAAQTRLPYAAGLYPAALVCGLAWHRLAALRFGHAVISVLGVAAVAAATIAASPLAELHAGILSRGWLEAATAPAALATFVFAVSAGFAWARGWILSRRQIDAAGFASGFQNGLVVLLLLLLLSTAMPQTGVATAIAIAAFLALGLLGLWHVRVAADATGRGIGTALLGLAAILLLGLAFWLLVDRALLEAVLRGAQWAAGRIGQAFAWIAAFLPATELPAQIPQAVSGGAAEKQPFSLSETVRIAARVIFVVMFAGFFAIALFRGLFDLLRWLRRREGGVAVAYERSTAGWAETLGHVLAWLRRLVRRRMHGAGPTADPVRAAYADVLRRLARRGWRRGAAETPDRFLDRLRPEWPGTAGDLAMLTRAYVSARYGPPAMRSEFSETAQRRLRRDLRKVKRGHDE
ncbi:MAG: DUF4129 domain-containing protein [Alphaproteobacteria bacterium]